MSGERSHDEEYGFERFISSQLDGLSKGQDRLAAEQKEATAEQKAMHAANQAKIDLIVADVAKINMELPTLRISRQVIFALVAMILAAVTTAWIASVVITKHGP